MRTKFISTLIGAVLFVAMFSTSGCFFDLGNPGPSFFERVEGEGSANAHSDYERGWEMMRRREFSDARAYFRKAHDAAPDNPLPAIGLIRAELELQSPRRALLVSGPARSKFPDDFEIQTLHAVALMSNQQFDRARRVLLGLQPQTARNRALQHRAMGDLAYRQNDIESARRFWRSSLESDPEQADLQTRLEKLERFLAAEGK